MRWYRAWYGSWNDPEGVRHLEPTFDKRDIFKRAQEAANRTGKVVTVECEYDYHRGIDCDFWRISPA